MTQCVKWARRPGDRDWLAVPLAELRIDIDASFFGPARQALDLELRRAGITLRPRFYLSTGYGCVVRTANVGLLFTDATPPLRRLAREAGLRVRGRADILRTLRHETAHAFCYSNRLYELPRFRALFGVTGDFFATYPDVWKPTRESRSRVARGELLGVYADRHGDEDFSICFQTWLADPAGSLAACARRPRIAGKLAFVADAVRQFGPRPAGGDPADLDEPIDAMTMSLGAWFDAVRRTGDYNLFPKGPVA